MPVTFHLPIFRSPRRTWALMYGAFALAVCPTLAAQATAAPQSGRLIAQRASASVVLLTMSDANGQPISLGSGFFVTEDVIATKQKQEIPRLCRGGSRSLTFPGVFREVATDLYPWWQMGCVE
jgi:hypothetical protein